MNSRGIQFGILVSIILIVLVVAIVAVAIYPKVLPLAKSILGLNATAILSPTEKMRNYADIFIEEYEKCIDIEDDNCKCVFDFDIEKGYAIRLSKAGDNLRILLMKIEGIRRKLKVNKIVGDIKKDIMPCVYVSGFKSTSDFVDIDDNNKLKIDGVEYDLPEQLILYKPDNDVCIVPSEEVGFVENLKICKEEMGEKEDKLIPNKKRLFFDTIVESFKTCKEMEVDFKDDEIGCWCARIQYEPELDPDWIVIKGDKGITKFEFKSKSRLLHSEQIINKLWEYSDSSLEPYLPKDNRFTISSVVRSNFFLDHVKNNFIYLAKIADRDGNVGIINDFDSRDKDLTTRKCSIEIIGNDDCVFKTNQALDLLRNKAKIHYNTIVKYIGIIECTESQSGMHVWEDLPRYQVGKATVDVGTIWYAGTIAHDACHSKQYHDYLFNNPSSSVPSDVYTGRIAEAQCLDVQYDALRKIGATQETLDYITNIMDSEYWNVDYGDRWW